MSRPIRRGEPGYEEARVGRLFNQRHPDRYPSAVLFAEDAEDVAAAVRWAGSPVSVRSGGHSWAAWSVRDDGLLIDLGHLNRLDYDEATGIVIAGPAARGGLDLSPFLAARGRAFPVGHCPEVGLGGFLLQGGQGWNGRRIGWACESVVAVDVVTADGSLVRADATHNSDLYWAARGAGPGFPGIVTAFHLQTYAAPAVMWHDTWSFDPDDAAVLLEWMHELLPRLDRRIEPVIAATRLTGELVLLLHTTVMADSDDEAAELLRVFADGPLAGRALDHVAGPTSLAEECVAQAAQNPNGYRCAVDCTWTDAPAGVLEVPDVGARADGRHRAARRWRLSRRHRLHPPAGPLPVRRQLSPSRGDPGPARSVRALRVLPDRRPEGAERP
jgi:FAD/FMN-containing dehydrogenase